jgi:hypothetical protein
MGCSTVARPRTAELDRPTNGSRTLLRFSNPPYGIQSSALRGEHRDARFFPSRRDTSAERSRDVVTQVDPRACLLSSRRHRRRGSCARLIQSRRSRPSHAHERTPRRGAATTQPNLAHPRRPHAISLRTRIRCARRVDRSPRGAAPPRRSRTLRTHAVPTRPHAQIHIVVRALAESQALWERTPRRGAATTQRNRAHRRRSRAVLARRELPAHRALPLACRIPARHRIAPHGKAPPRRSRTRAPALSRATSRRTRSALSRRRSPSRRTRRLACRIPVGRGRTQVTTPRKPQPSPALPRRRPAPLTTHAPHLARR